MAIADSGFRSGQFLHHVAKQALEVDTETGGPDHPNVAASLSATATLFRLENMKCELPRSPTSGRCRISASPSRLWMAFWKSREATTCARRILALRSAFGLVGMLSP